MEFNEKLQELRKRKGLTQEELAQALYVSRTAVSKWESGRGYPNLDSLKAIALFFDVTVDSLLSGDRVLTIAQDEQKEKRAQLCDGMFGLLNCGMVLLFFLPCFGQMVDGVLQAVSLVGLTDVAPYMRWLYGGVACAAIVVGIFFHSRHPVWVVCKYKLSLILGAVGVLLFILGSQPYAATLVFAFLTMQVWLLLKQ